MLLLDTASFHYSEIFLAFSLTHLHSCYYYYIQVIIVELRQSWQYGNVFLNKLAVV